MTRQTEIFVSMVVSCFIPLNNSFHSPFAKTANEKVLIDFAKTHEDHGFAPDGMTIDENGNLYVATWNGGRIIIINPVTKKILREISMPTPKVTSVRCFCYFI